MENKTKDNLLDHSAAKVRLLKEYMAAYLGILSNTNWIKDILIFDLFSGPGLYNDGGEGSPFIFLKEIIKAHNTVVIPRNISTSFHCLFNDIDKDRITQLQNNIQLKELDISKFGSIEYRSEDYKEILKEVVNITSKFKEQRGFVFIDPYGYREVNINDISSILQSGKTEVLLFMPIHHMFRFKDNGTPECLIEFMEDLDITNKIAGVKGIEFINLVKDGFQNKLGDKIYVDSFVISRDLNQFFCLFFFTSNLLGFVKMLEAKWKIDQEEGRGWQSNSNSVINLFNQSSQSPNTFKLKEIIINELKKGPKSAG